MKLDLTSGKKIVIKIGSSLLVENGSMRQEWLKSLASDIASLTKDDIQIIIVSSGSIALGKRFIKNDGEKLSLKEKQAAASIGQIELMGFCRELFKIYDLDVAQILLTVSDCNDRQRYLNSQNTIETLLKNDIIPIINENDTITVDEIKIGDNDRLAARVAQMISADLLILFSDVDGLYDKNPNTNQDAQLVQEVEEITKEIEEMASGAISEVGTGGMVTKIKAAKMAASSACDTIITNGLTQNPLKNLLEDKQNYTIFRSNISFNKSRKSWISGFLNTRGEVFVNDRAKEALLSKKTSLLPVGVTKINGRFDRGAAIFINDEDGNHIASGLSNYSSTDATKIIGKNSKETKEIFGPNAKTELVHIDDLVVMK